MKPDLSSQLRAYFAMVDAAQPALQPAEVIGRGAAVRPLSVGRPIARRPGFVVAAAAGLAAIVGAAVVLSVRPWAGGDVADLGPSTSPVVVPSTGTGAPDTLPSPDAWCAPGVAPLSAADDVVAEDAAWGPDGSRWEIVDPPEPGNELRRTLPDGGVVGYPMPDQAKDFGTGDWPPPDVEPTLYPPFDLEVAADGTVWLASVDGPSGYDPWTGLLRFDPDDPWVWEEVDVGEQAVVERDGMPFSVAVVGIEATCDGRVWALVTETHAWAASRAEQWWLARFGDGGVARVPFDLGPGTLPPPVSGGADPVLEVVGAPPALLVADDRAVWLAHGDGHWYGDVFPAFSGVVRWDGERWTRYLDGELVPLLDVHDDGTATATNSRGDEILIEP